MLILSKAYPTDAIATVRGRKFLWDEEEAAPIEKRTVMLIAGANNERFEKEVRALLAQFDETDAREKAAKKGEKGKRAKKMTPARKAAEEAARVSRRREVIADAAPGIASRTIWLGGANLMVEEGVFADIGPADIPADLSDEEFEKVVLAHAPQREAILRDPRFKGFAKEVSDTAEEEGNFFAEERKLEAQHVEDFSAGTSIGQS